MDLISRKALLNHLNDVWLTNTPNGSYDMQAAKAEGIAITMKAVEDFRTVPAVPLDKLCEWLGKFANPCKIGIRCYYPDDNNEDCMPTVECWRYVLTKWMEEQDAAD